MRKGEYIQIYATNNSTGIRYWLSMNNGNEIKTEYEMLHKTNFGVYIQYNFNDDNGISSRVEYDIIRFKRLQTAKRLLKLNDYKLLMEISV